MEESGLNKAYMGSVKFVINFSIFFGCFFTIMQLLFFNKFLSVLGLIPIIVGYYFKKRVVRVYTIGADSITLKSGKKEVKLLKTDIISIAKVIRFTATERFWLILTFCSQDKKKKDRYFFMNEPGSNFLELFKNMGIQLKNMP
jgi:hypothetical protein